jgi:hypothetical protein
MEKPHWWSSLHDLSWAKVKDGVIEEWHRLQARAQKLEKSAVEKAAAFGHEARSAYQRLGKWSSEVEARLKTDWESTYKDANLAWDRVRDAVKHGWERAQKSAPATEKKGESDEAHHN